MSTTEPAMRAEPVLLYRPLAVMVAAGGCVLLLARPPLLRSAPEPVTVLLLLFAALLLVGWAWPASSRAVPAPTPRGAAVLALGLAAFAAGRLLGGGEPVTAPLARLLALNTLAAVAEEAFFRRLVYGALLPGGATVAVIGSALLFAVVHVTVYGAWVLPVDVAAGLVLSWQRWASGSWRVPAVTHTLANVLVVL